MYVGQTGRTFKDRYREHIQAEDPTNKPQNTLKIYLKQDTGMAQ
jgi:hypothetical protein